MRTKPRFLQNPQARQKLRKGLFMALIHLVPAAAIAATFPLPAEADPISQQAGRRISTGPKAAQLGFDGTILSPAPAGSGITIRNEQAGRAPLTASSTYRSGAATITGGRLLRATPNQPFSVGLVGCPGCTALLMATGGILIDFENERVRPQKQNIRPRRQR